MNTDPPESCGNKQAEPPFVAAFAKKNDGDRDFRYPREKAVVQPPARFARKMEYFFYDKHFHQDRRSPADDIDRSGEKAAEYNTLDRGTTVDIHSLASHAQDSTGVIALQVKNSEKQ